MVSCDQEAYDKNLYDEDTRGSEDEYLSRSLVHWQVYDY